MNGFKDLSRSDQIGFQLRNELEIFFFLALTSFSRSEFFYDPNFDTTLVNYPHSWLEIFVGLGFSATQLKGKNIYMREKMPYKVSRSTHQT